MFDYHVHTTQSADCITPINDSCEAAIRAGVTEIAERATVLAEIANRPRVDSLVEKLIEVGKAERRIVLFAVPHGLSRT